MASAYGSNTLNFWKAYLSNEVPVNCLLQYSQSTCWRAALSFEGVDSELPLCNPGDCEGAFIVDDTNFAFSEPSLEAKSFGWLATLAEGDDLFRVN